MKSLAVIGVALVVPDVTDSPAVSGQEVADCPIAIIT